MYEFWQWATAAGRAAGSELSIPRPGYPAPPQLPRPGPTRTCQPQGTKAEPRRPLLQPEDESRGLSGECGPQRLEAPVLNLDIESTKLLGNL